MRQKSGPVRISILRWTLFVSLRMSTTTVQDLMRCQSSYDLILISYWYVFIACCNPRLTHAYNLQLQAKTPLLAFFSSSFFPFLYTTTLRNPFPSQKLPTINHLSNQKNPSKSFRPIAFVSLAVELFRFLSFVRLSAERAKSDGRGAPAPTPPPS